MPSVTPDSTAASTTHRHAVMDAVKASKLDCESKLLLIYIADRCYGTKTESCPSFARLAMETQISVRTVARRIAALRERGWLQVRKVRSQFNCYTITPVEADLMTAEQIAAPVLAARAVTEAKQDAYRAKRAVERATAPKAVEAPAPLVIDPLVAYTMMSAGVRAKPPTQRQCYDAARAVGVADDALYADYQDIVAMHHENRASRQQAPGDAAAMH